MIRFEPSELKSQFVSALEIVQPLLWYEWLPFTHPSFDTEGYVGELVITPDTELENSSLLGAKRSEKLTVRDVIEMVRVLDRFKLKNRTSLRMDTKTLICVAPRSQKDEGLGAAISAGNVTAESMVDIEGDSYKISLISGFTEFAIFISAEGKNSAIAPCYSETTYVKVEHTTDAPEQTVLEVAKSFLFELAASSDFCFTIEEYPSDDDMESEGDEEPTVKMRPLVVGPGLSDVHELFAEGCSAHPAEYALIHFVKIIEYVSATVIRTSRHDALRRRLTSRAALSPDATFLDGLAQVIEEQRIFNKDSEALKVTLQACCDPVLLAEHAPRVVGELARLKSSDDAKAKRAALDKLSAVLSATRNQLSHAKANYEPSGDECPEAQLAELTICARAAAEQVIRWFANLPAHSRVV